MRHLVCLLFFARFFAPGAIAQMQDPDNAVQLSHNFDQHQGRLDFYSDNKDFCDYYLSVTFLYCEGFEGMASEATITANPGRWLIKTYRMRKDATRYSYNYRYSMCRGNYRKKPDIDFIYALPGAEKGAVTAWIAENQEGYQLSFDLTSDTVFATRSGVVCDDNLKDNTAKGHKRFNDNRKLSQITLYHADGTFGEYIFKGKPLIFPGQKARMGAPIAVVERTERLCFSVYFLDKNKLKDMNIGNKHTHFRPFFQTANEGKTRLESNRTYLCESTDEMLTKEMGKREKKDFMNSKSKK